MRYALVLLSLMVFITLSACSKDQKPAGSSTDATDIAPPPAPTPVAPPAAPTDTTAVNTTTPTVVEPAPIAPAAPAMGGTYVVKKGDTLWGIAKAKYGDGKQWKKIAEANPGLTPKTLKVGMKITLP